MKTIVISCTFTIMLLAGSTASASPLTWAQVGNLDTLVPGGVRDDPQAVRSRIGAGLPACSGFRSAT